MIIVRFTSGLGNQMFQYNLYSFLRERYPDTQVRADVRWFYTEDEHHGFELERIFANVEGSRFSLDEATAAEIYMASGQIPALVRGPLAPAVKYLLGPVNRKLREAGKPEKCGITLDQLAAPISRESILNLDVTRNCYIFGFFIEEAYYRDRTEKLRSELKFPPFAGQNAELAAKMAGEESVAVHVRRGDYLSAKYSDKFLCLGMDYYEKAVGIIKEKFDDPVFYIFSEDPDYVREAFSWLPEKTVITHNTGNESYRDMQLMTKCRAVITANSTFSQLGSVLNENPGHITVYPARYMKDEDAEVRTMPGWIRV
ncbi:MAG: alpha-1,2-fucosyltransferase [Lachnospiraceae bacterium]|nr:alpha-1,2-fucosyltransferase [Lachnospiraceae bacterium]